LDFASKSMSRRTIPQVFTEAAEAVLANLSRRDGDGGLRPEVMPMKPWPKEERDKTLKGILKLNYLNEDHKAEWISWFQQISDVSHHADGPDLTSSICRICKEFPRA
jgi:hypothetical protein